MSLKTVLEELQFTLCTPCIVFLWTWWGSPQPDPCSQSLWMSKIKSKHFFFCKSKHAKDWGEGKVSSPALYPSVLVYWGQMTQSFVLFFFFVKRNSFAMDWKLHASEEGFPLPVEYILLHLTCMCKCILDMPYWVEALLLAVKIASQSFSFKKVFQLSDCYLCA